MNEKDKVGGIVNTHEYLSSPPREEEVVLKWMRIADDYSYDRGKRRKNKAAKKAAQDKAVSNRRKNNKAARRSRRKTK